MELSLTPREADATAVEVAGGAYFKWTPAKYPILAAGNMAAGRLHLRPRGFALPHNSDVVKIGYVIQGECTVGLILPDDPKERIVIIKEGDVIPVPLGAYSWWFNGGDSDVVIIFLGETSKSHKPGDIDYFILAGPIGIFSNFSSEFIAKIYGVTEEVARKLTESQKHPLIITVDEKVTMPDRSNSDDEKLFSSVVGGHGSITADNLPFLQKLGVSCTVGKLTADSAASPTYTNDGSTRIFYIVKGSGKVQIVGLNGARILDSHVEEQQLFVVPRFFAVALIAGGEGLDFFSVTTSSRPETGDFGGSSSVLKALSSSVLQASLNIDLELVESFKSKIEF